VGKEKVARKRDKSKVYDSFLSMVCVRTFTSLHKTSVTQPITIEGPLIVDVHTHLYPDEYHQMLLKRKTVPYVYEPSSGRKYF
jgi:hypothetical protein